MQQALFTRLKPALLPAKGKAFSRPPANEYAEMWRAAASLERLDAKTKEQLGGYYLINADSAEEAIEIAGRVPAARVGTIEVRPLVEISGLP